MENLIGFAVLIFIAFALYQEANKKIKKAKRVAKKFGIGTGPSRKAAKYEAMSKEEIEAEVEKLVEKVKSHAGIESLVERLDKTQEKIDDTENASTLARLEEKEKILEAAIEEAYEKPFRYYVEASELDLTAPLEAFKYLGKTITPKKYEEFDDDLKSYFNEITFGDVTDLDEANEIATEEVMDDAKEMHAFKKIADNPEISDEEKIKKLDRLVKRSEFLANEFEDPDADYENYYYQYLRMQETRKLRCYNIPKLDLFLDNGYDTLEKIVSVPREEILSWDGIGPKTLKKIVASQEELKKEIQA